MKTQKVGAVWFDQGPLDDQIKICCIVDGKPAEGVLTMTQAQALQTLLTVEIMKSRNKQKESA